MIKGVLFNGKTSGRQEVFLVCDATGQVHFEGSDSPALAFNQLKTSPRIGSTPRYILLPDGSQFETADNKSIDELLAQWPSDSSGFHRVIHQLESHKRYVIFAVVFLIAFSWLFIKHGIPYFSRDLAMALPTQISSTLGDGVLKSIDDYWLDESQLESVRQKQLEQLFISLLPQEREQFDWHIVFREGGALGANAFALPNGTVVFTDELIALASNDQQIAAVMLHEMGHVLNRHGLRTVIQKSSLALFIMLISGDVSTSSSIITALPAVLLEAGYSKTMEWEADSYALEYMLSHAMDPNYFADIMEKLDLGFAPKICSEAGSEAKKEMQEPTVELCEKTENQPIENKKREDKNNSIGDYFSTHPPTRNRIERFRKAERPKE